MTTLRIHRAAALAALLQINFSAPAQLLPVDAGTTVAGYQDDFDGATLNPNWVVRGQNVYSLNNGVLRVATTTGDPNHLLYEVAGYNNSVQEVLARIRLVNFGTGDQPRAGVGTAVDPATSQGINLHFRDEPVAGQRHVEFLDDTRQWEPTEFAFNWQLNTWYWLRQRHEPNAASQGGVNDVFGKVWLADGSTAEPSNWQYTWDYTPARTARAGFAGITAGSSGGTADFDVDYVLIKASGLPNITVAPNAFVQTPVALTNQPQNLTALECTPVSFSVIASGNPRPTYQWFRNGSLIPNATNSSYIIASARPGDAGTYRVVAQNVVSNTTYMATSSNATLTISADTSLPRLISALALGLTQVQVTFNERVNAATANDRNNYALTNTGGSVTISNVLLDASGTNAILSVNALTLNATYTMIVNNIRDDCSGLNPINPNSTVTFTVTDFTSENVGSATPAGSTTAAGNGLNVTGGGSDIGGTNDQFQFTWQLRNGDFDVKVRIESLGLSDAWAEAGLMARETLVPGSRFASVMATPSLSGTYFQSRTTTAGTTTLTGTFLANYPNTWLRLRRVGAQLTGYAGYDGESWFQLGTASITANPIYLGFAVSSHNTNQTTTAAFRDFANVTTASTLTARPNIEPLGQSSRRTSLVISEIMFNPLDRADGKNLEFVELFNALGEPQDISGYRLDGDADFAFPANTVIPSGGFLVVAQSPADLQAVYGISGVLGPFSSTNSLPNSRGTIQLRHRTGAVFLEAHYDTEAPWPAAADGAGHSLLLARPSFGEGNVQAWAASDLVGGSPGRLDPVTIDPLRNVVINEFLAHTDDPELDFIELYNHSNQQIDISSCFLSDARNTNKFAIPSGTILPPRGFASFNQNQLGFSLGSGGETIYFRNPSNTRVLDAVRFEAQANGVSSGRYPDGAPGFTELSGKTPGTNNSPFLIRDIVINEIMYNPISRNSDDEFVELYNRGNNPVNVGRWRMTGGISFTIPANTTIPANGFLVIARNAARLISRYPNLNANNTLGDFDGSLANGGEQIALAIPDPLFTTNNGSITTNFNYIVVDEVTYSTGGRWGQWTDGGGSSLELIDPRSDNRLAANWAGSDETAKAPWTLVSVSGVLDNANGTTAADQLQVLLQGPGECLIDEVEVVTLAGVNVIANSTFEAGATGWVAEGTEAASSLETTEGYNSRQSYHVRATDRGDNQINRIRTPMSPAQSGGTTNTIRAKVRWLRGHPELVFRYRWNWLEAAVQMELPTNLGTPGARNSRAVTNAPPAIYDVTHYPPVPAANEAVVVTARVHDPDGVPSIQLRYRIDPSATLTSVPMLDNGSGGDAVAGDGLYSATIPGQAANTLVAFHVQATDGFTPAATSTFPNDATTRECLVRFGESVPPGSFPSYRMWMTAATFTQWDNRNNLDNRPNDVTFVLGNHRVVYNIRALFAGSPYIAPGFNTPTGNRCGYALDFPGDEPIMGDNGLNLDWPGGHGAGTEPTAIQEEMAYYIADQMNIPFSHRYFIRLTVNGVTDMQRGGVFEAALQPGGEFLKQWSPGDSDGDFFRIDRSFEFDDNSARVADPMPQLRVYSTPDLVNGGTKKDTEAYRWMWLKRSTDFANDYTNLFVMADVLNATNLAVYTEQTEALADLEEWMAMFAAEHIINNFDSWGHDIGKNMYMYKPQNGRWQLYMYDLDWLMLVSPVGPGAYSATTGPLFSGNDPTVLRMYNHPPFRRAYFRAIENAVNNAFVQSKYEAVMDAKYNSLVANGITLSDANALLPPTTLKTWFGQRRGFLLSQLAPLTNALTVNTSAIAVTNNVATISGTAPITVQTLRFGSKEWPVTWTSVTNWTARVPVNSTSNRLTVLGYDQRGNLVGNASNQITVVAAPPAAPSPEGVVVFNEIMFNPRIPGAEYVELFNTSSNFTFDLSGWSINGLDYTFPPGSFIAPQSFLVLAKDIAAFGVAYGGTILVFDQFVGNLQSDGETISLIKPRAGAGGTDLVVDRVRYEPSLPWPAGADGTGSSYQLIDARQDNSRAGNWTTRFTPGIFYPAVTNTGWQFRSLTANAGGAGATRLLMSLDTIGELYVDDIWLVDGTNAAVGANYIRNGDFETTLLEDPPLTNTWIVPTNYTNTAISSQLVHSGSSSLQIVCSLFGNTVNPPRILIQNLSPAPTNSGQYTLSFWFYSTNTANNITVRLLNTLLNMTVNVRPTVTIPSNKPPIVSISPGAVNQQAATLPTIPPLWINEVQPDNTSGIQDSAGERDPWIELYNSGTTAVSLDGLFLSNNYTNQTQWAFPSGRTINPGQFMVIFCDGQPAQTTLSQLHTSFRLPSSSGSVGLWWLPNDTVGIRALDYVNYTGVRSNRSFGSFPDGQPFDRLEFAIVTPGATNNSTSAPLVVKINEWMAANTATIADPADGDFDDWFELYNPGDSAVDLAGYFLTDNLADKFQYRITTDGAHVIPARGYLLVWADGETGQNVSGGVARPDLHVDFRLSAGGEGIGLFAADGTQIDAITFTNLVDDVGQGRLPDGSANIVLMPASATPRVSNALSISSGPQFSTPTLNGRNFSLIWTTTAGRSYRVEYKDRLDAPAWTPLGSNLIANGSTLSITNSTTNSPQRFFRIQLLP